MDLVHKHKVLESNSSLPTTLSDLRHIPHARASRPRERTKRQCTNDRFERLRREFCGAPRDLGHRNSSQAHLPKPKTTCKKADKFSFETVADVSASNLHAFPGRHSYMTADSRSDAVTSGGRRHLSEPRRSDINNRRTMSGQPESLLRDHLSPARPLTSVTQVESSDSHLPFSSNPHKTPINGRLASRTKAPAPALDFGVAFLGQVPRAPASMPGSDAADEYHEIETPSIEFVPRSHAQLMSDASLQNSDNQLRNTVYCGGSGGQPPLPMSNISRHSSQTSHRQDTVNDYQTHSDFRFSKTPKKAQFPGFCMHKKPLYPPADGATKHPYRVEKVAFSRKRHQDNVSLDDQHFDPEEDTLARISVQSSSNSAALNEPDFRSTDKRPLRSLQRKRRADDSDFDYIDDGNDVSEEENILVDDRTLSVDGRENRIEPCEDKATESRKYVHAKSTHTTSSSDARQPRECFASVTDSQATRQAKHTQLRQLREDVRGQNNQTSPLFNPTSTVPIEHQRPDESDTPQVSQIRPDDFLDNFFSSDGIFVPTANHYRSSSNATSVLLPFRQANSNEDAAATADSRRLSETLPSTQYAWKQGRVTESASPNEVKDTRGSRNHHNGWEHQTIQDLLPDLSESEST